MTKVATMVNCKKQSKYQQIGTRKNQKLKITYQQVTTTNTNNKIKVNLATDISGYK